MLSTQPPKVLLSLGRLNSGSKYAVVGGSEVVVGASIASYDLIHRIMVVLTVRRRAPATSHPTNHSITLHTSLKVLLSLSRSKRARIKYVVDGNSSKVVHGISNATYAPMLC